MPTANTGNRESVVQAKQDWRQGFDAIKMRHYQGETGRNVCRSLSDLLDQVLVQLYQAAIADISPELVSRISLVLLGGCGRRDIAPHSDVDLMLLYQGSVTDDLVEFSRRLTQDITDAGFHLGYSMRTVREACSMAVKDAYIFSSLTEARLLIGNEDLFENFQGRFQRNSKRRTVDLIKGIIDARDEERIEFGDTVYLLRPNIKKSRGGLRDIHLIRWLSYVVYSETDVDAIYRAGGLSTADSTQLKQSHEFLLRLRNEMHYHAGRTNDGLGRDEQVRLAEFFGYAGDDALLSVETFMRDYFRYTSRIDYVCNHFVSKCTSTRKNATAQVLAPLITRQIDQHFRMGPNQIGVIASALDDVKMDLEQVLRLMQLACLHDKTIEHETWISIRHAMLKFPEIPFTREAARRFMALLSNTRGLAQSLHRLHEMQVLSKIIPGFDHARGLLQFNEYHKYTVDEHSIRAVANATKFETEDSVAGETYRKIREKNVLHLALLLHDLGKGFTEDHSDVGARMAVEIGERFDLPDDTIEDIVFLVQHHLVMSHLAFHRDINDLSLIAELASNVGSVHRLSMLYVLTCADIAAVGPNVMSAWKLGLLTDLFQQTKTILTGETPEDDPAKRYRLIHEYVASFAFDEELHQWLLSIAKNLPNNYCTSRSPDSIAQCLLDVKSLDANDVMCQVNAANKSGLYELCLVNTNVIRSGVLYKLIGMMSSMGLQIRTADIKSLGGPLMFFWIQFEDQEFQDPPESRLNEIRNRARNLCLGTDDEPPRFRKVWKKEVGPAVKISRPKIEVRIDNQTVGNATIIDVFAYDKTGLLYKILKKIFRLGLDVTYARVSTYAHRVIDVFYVTDEHGNKIRNKNQIQIIRREVSEAVNEFLEPAEEKQ